jgi:hypothetical protein
VALLRAGGAASLAACKPGVAFAGVAHLCHVSAVLQVLLALIAAPLQNALYSG